MQRGFPFVLCSIVTANMAEAGQGLLLHGVFCNTEAQIETTLDFMRDGIAVDGAIALTNASAVVCVLADQVNYMVTAPVSIGNLQFGQFQLTKYKATLVGVMVGENPRPIDPPVPIYFIPDRKLTDVAVADGV